VETFETAKMTKKINAGNVELAPSGIEIQ